MDLNGSSVGYTNLQPLFGVRHAMARMAQPVFQIAMKEETPKPNPKAKKASKHLRFQARFSHVLWTMGQPIHSSLSASDMAMACNPDGVIPYMSNSASSCPSCVSQWSLDLGGDHESFRYIYCNSDKEARN